MTPPARLTPRELRLLRAYCRHHTYKRAAHELGLAQNSVSKAISDACRREGADGVLDLLARIGWLSPPEP